MGVYHLHLVSDSTGGDADLLAIRPCLAQFEGVAVEQHFRPWYARRNIAAVGEAIAERPAWCCTPWSTTVWDVCWNNLRVRWRCSPQSILARAGAG